MSEVQHNLFVYGTLCDPEVRKAVFGEVLDGVPDRLNGYIKLDNVIMNRYPNLRSVSDSSRFVDGLVLHLDSNALLQADSYETDAYRRIVVSLESGRDAWVYLGDNTRK